MTKGGAGVFGWDRPDRHRCRACTAVRQEQETKAAARIRRAKRFKGGSFFRHRFRPNCTAVRNRGEPNVAHCKVLTLTAGRVAPREQSMAAEDRNVLRDWVRISAGIFLFLRLRAGAVPSAKSEHREAAAGLRARRDRAPENLSHLPPGVWHNHVGDLATLEDPSVDDSSWPVAKAGFDISRTGALVPRMGRSAEEPRRLRP